MDYKEKLRLAKEALDSGSYDRETIEYIFPELKESENERIRKQLLNWFKDCKWDAIDNETLKRDDIIAWLEKQGEQKPAWSEKDEMFVHGLIRGLAAKRDIHGHTTFSSDCIDITETITWLESIKERMKGE